MNRFKMQGYVKEFPFLKEISETVQMENSTEIEFIKIAKVDENLLNKIPYYSGATGSCVGIEEGEDIYFILNDNKIIFDAVKPKGYVTHNEAHTNNEEWEGDSILEAIDKWKVIDSLKYIVVKQYGYNIRDHYSEGGLNFTIYKVANNEIIKEIIDRIKQKEIQLIKAEVNF